MRKIPYRPTSATLARLAVLALVFFAVFGIWKYAVSPKASIKTDLAGQNVSSQNIIENFLALPAYGVTQSAGQFQFQNDSAEEGDIKINLPQNYSGSIEVKLDQEKSVRIFDNNNSGIDKASALPGPGRGLDQKENKFIKYQSKDGRKTIYYSYQKDFKNGQKKLKNWIVYKSGTGEEKESYKIENAVLAPYQNGSVAVYYADKSTDEKKNSGDEKTAKIPDLLIDRPYYFDKDGKTHDLDWKVDEEKNEISLEFKADKNSYPLTLDPTITHNSESQFDAGIALNRTESIDGPKIQSGYHELPADKNTVGLWHMNETANDSCSGGQDVCDFSGNGNHGIATGAAINTTSQILGSGARSFNGSSDYINYGTGMNANFVRSKAFSISTWMKTSGTAAAAIIDNCDWSSPYAGGEVSMNASGTIKFDLVQSETKLIRKTTISTVNDNAWHHIAITYNGSGSASGLSIYIDGLVAVVTTDYDSMDADLTSTTNLQIGARDGANMLFNGLIDEVRISNVVRTPEEIKADAQRFPYAVYDSSVMDLGAGAASLSKINWTENGVMTGDGETIMSGTSLVAQWNFNETSGTTASVAAGSCATACNGTLTNFADTSGQDIGSTAPDGWTANNRLWGTGAVLFDGINDYINAGTNPALDITGNITLETWFKPLAAGAADSAAAFIWKGHIGSATDQSYGFLWTNSNKPIFRLGTASTIYESAARTALTLGKWYHVVGTYDGNTMKIYINGKLDNSSTIGSITIKQTTKSLFFGASYTTAMHEYVKCFMDSTRIYSRALSADEIMSNYNAGSIDIQTRSGSSANPDDGTWETWKPSGTETQILSMDNDADYWNIDSGVPAVSQYAAIQKNDTDANSGSGNDGDCIIDNGTKTLDSNAGSSVCNGSARSTAYAVNYSSAVLSSAGSTYITASSAPTGIAAGDEILIINLQGTNGSNSTVGQYETHVVSSIATNNINFTDYSLKNTYDGTTQKIMIQRVPNFGNVTICGGNTGGGCTAAATLTASAWNGTKGGVLFFRSNGTATVNSGGTITANSLGYRGGAGGSGGAGGQNGESYDGYVGTGGANASTGTSGGGTGNHHTAVTSAGTRGGGGGGGGNSSGQNDDGGGGAGGGGYGTGGAGGGGSTDCSNIPGAGGVATGGGSAGGGGGNSGCNGTEGGGKGGNSGSAGTNGNSPTPGYNGTGGAAGSGATTGQGGSSNDGATGIGAGGAGGGGLYGSSYLNKLFLGSGGGGGGGDSLDGQAPNGGAGAGIITIFTDTLTNNGSITANGADGSNASGRLGAGGSGAGGSILIKAAVIGQNSTLTASGGATTSRSVGGGGGGGGYGRVAFFYGNSISGSATPTAYSQKISQQIKIEGDGAMQIKTGAPQADSSTVGLWHLDETNTGIGATAYDSSGNGYNGIMSGTAPGPSLVDGISGKAKSFSGSEKILLPDIASAGSQYTLEAWVRPNILAGSWGAVVIKENSYGMWISATGIVRCHPGNGSTWGSNVDSAAGMVPVGQWTHIACAYNGSTLTPYINGSSNGTPLSYSGAPGDNANVVEIGKRAAAGNESFSGSIDEVRISNTVRSAEEIAESYRAGRDHRISRTISSTDLSEKNKIPFYVAADRPGTYLEAAAGESSYANYEPDANTVGFWHLDEQSGSGAYIKDNSTSANHGTLGTGSSAPAFAQGKIGGARFFDGSYDYIGAGTGTSLAVESSPFTIEAWVNPAVVRNQVILFKSTADFSGLGWGLIMNRISSDISLTKMGVTDQPVSYIFYPNNWYHIAVVQNAAYVEYFINGASIGIYSNSTPFQSSSGKELRIGGGNSYTSQFSGSIDEVRISNSARTASEIRQAYEVGKRTHPITIDFAASLDSGNLISGTADTSFTINSQTYGAQNKGDNIYAGDKIIVRENYEGTEYIAQGTVSGVNVPTGAVTVSSWDSGSTAPSGGYTTGAVLFKWQREYWDITGPLDSQVDAVTKLTLRQTDGNEGRTIYLDDFKSLNNYLTDPTASGNITSTLNRYFQYRSVFSTSDTNVSPYLSNISTIYTDPYQDKNIYKGRGNFQMRGNLKTH